MLVGPGTAEAQGLEKGKTFGKVQREPGASEEPDLGTTVGLVLFPPQNPESPA